jgi:hypothetical protein
MGRNPGVAKESAERCPTDRRDALACGAVRGTTHLLQAGIAQRLDQTAADQCESSAIPLAIPWFSPITSSPATSGIQMSRQRAVQLPAVPHLETTRRAAQILTRPPATLKRWRHGGIGRNWIDLDGRVSYDVAVLLD